LLPPVNVAIRLGEEKGDDVDPRPSALTLQLAVFVVVLVSRRRGKSEREEEDDGPLLQVALSDPPESESADGEDGTENDGTSGTLGGKVAAVLDGSETLCWGEISAVGEREKGDERGEGQGVGGGEGEREEKEGGRKGSSLLDGNNHSNYRRASLSCGD
jgi:hypothetical protein